MLAMGCDMQQSRDVVITNPLGFHVRPIQRFAEMAKAFRGEVSVSVEDRSASGKSTLALMSLQAVHGSHLQISTCGEDASQALEVLSMLVENDFYVEEVAREVLPADRHLSRLASLASCFESEVWVDVDGERANGRSVEELGKIGLTPLSAVSFEIRGKDAEQARRVLESLVNYHFYVEEEAAPGKGAG